MSDFQPQVSINLKHWRILDAVVECGSFASAAIALSMSQPAVSYSIAKMEEQMGVTLLRQVGRRALLTEQGAALLERARGLLRDAFELEEYAASIRKGVGPQFRLAIDRDFPSRALFSKLRGFTSFGRPVRVQLLELSATSVLEMLRTRSVDMAIVDRVPADATGAPCGEVEYVVVAHPSHPLSLLERDLTQGDLDREVQVVLVTEADRLERRGSKPQWAPKWRVSNYDTAETAVLDGVGYACMPRHRIEGLLKAGRLRQLNVNGRSVQRVIYYAVTPGPAVETSDAQRLSRILAGQ